MQSLQELPIDYLALHEQYEISQALGQEAKAKAAWHDLWRILSREPDSVLEVAFLTMWPLAASGGATNSRRGD